MSVGSLIVVFNLTPRAFKNRLVLKWLDSFVFRDILRYFEKCLVVVMKLLLDLVLDPTLIVVFK